MQASATDALAYILGLETLEPRIALLRQLTGRHLERHELGGRIPAAAD